MIAVAGGTYVEVCHWPPRRVLFGSGGRAAAAISDILKASDITLYSYIGNKERETLGSIAGVFGFSTDASRVPRTVAFNYFHPLSVPEIIPPPHDLAPASPIEVKAKHVLRYGFIEGDAVVRGNHVVYDPQNAWRPKPFRENGSTARRLAIVLNRREGEIFTRQKDPSAIVKAVARLEDADAVVLKMGPMGSLVFERGRMHHVPCYKTEFIWPIGSGDVFAAVFFAYWAVLGHRAREAADLASRGTALYCNTESLPVLRKDLMRKKLIPVGAKGVGRPRAARMAYLAGPFFTLAQRWLIEQAREGLLGVGLGVFSPFHDIGHGAAEDVVSKDIRGLKRSNVLFAVLDGLDSGTLFEVGYARALGIPVIAFAQNESTEAVKMLLGTDCRIERDLASAIYKTAWLALDR